MKFKRRSNRKKRNIWVRLSVVFYVIAFLLVEGLVLPIIRITLGKSFLKGKKVSWWNNWVKAVESELEV